MTIINISPPPKKYLKLDGPQKREQVFFTNWIKFLLFFLFFALIVVMLLIPLLMVHNENEKALTVYDLHCILSTWSSEFLDFFKAHFNFDFKNYSIQSININQIFTGKSKSSNSESTKHSVLKSENHSHSNRSSKPLNKSSSKTNNNRESSLSYRLIEDFIEYYFNKSLLNTKCTEKASKMKVKYDLSHPSFSVFSITDKVIRAQPLKGSYGLKVTRSYHHILLVNVNIPSHEMLIEAKLGIPGCHLKNTNNTNSKHMNNKTNLVEEKASYYKRIQLYEILWPLGKNSTVLETGFKVSTIYTYIFTNSTTKTLFIDVTETVSRWIKNPSQLYGFYMKFEDDSKDDSKNNAKSDKSTKSKNNNSNKKNNLNDSNNDDNNSVLSSAPKTSKSTSSHLKKSLKNFQLNDLNSPQLLIISKST